MWLFMKPIENMCLQDWSCIKLINGLIRSIYVENWKRETDYFKKVVQEIAKKLKNCEDAVRHFPGFSPAWSPPIPQKLESNFSAFFAALNLAVIGSLVKHVNVHIGCHLFVSIGESTLGADVCQRASRTR